ncbi:hypothetical protein ACPPVV_13630 [Rhodanobacter sp. Col0626]|uniref:hypothetical protein n=1 Tax=Rhodanobacter sp. Col0626 TaxID=3415679 RepID=UPI003CF1152C
MLDPIAAWKKATVTLSRRLHELNNEQTLLHQEYARIKESVSACTPENPALYGYKVYSQFDEDGIIAYIFSKLGLGDRIFVEIGCSDGLENNTHTLLLQGWRGAWIDADARKISYISKQLPDNRRLVIKQAFVSVKNVGKIVSEALTALRTSSVDFLSVDIDGDDLNVLTTLLEDNRPRVICAEYNAKFPPPINVAIQAKANKFWQGDDYQGASLMAFLEALRPLGYTLITCGLSGVNAFFVRDSDSVHFPHFTVEQLFQEPRYYLRRLASGHRPSLKFLADQMSVNDQPILPDQTSAP